MPQYIHIRTVNVELLRAGPAHNQLLSPLTQYLGVCDDAEAGIVMLPFEQHTFERRMRAMRHDDKAVSADKQPDLRDLGVEMARVLGSIPRLPGSLGADPRGQDTLVRLSLTLSASELAGLPFELAKVPVGPNACTESWLALQARVPVVITRRTRNVAVFDLKWLMEPRILFIASNPKGTPRIPFKEHRKALIDAITPFLMPADLRQPRRNFNLADDEAEAGAPRKDAVNRREEFGDLLTILSNATFDEVVRECARNRYSHVHILAHGAQDGSFGDRTHGLALHEKDGVISGERLASAFACLVGGNLHRPQVVTLATCDSGNSSELVTPGASIAHVLHQAGIPMVVASQVPLSMKASVLFAREFYTGLLWGEHPWILMHRVRSSLHGHLGASEHDWASVVVYEALPSDMTRQLEGAVFRQCQRAMEVAFLPDAEWPEVASPIHTVIDRLPVHGQFYGMEAIALRADGRLSIANNVFLNGVYEKANDSELTNRALESCYWLEQALVDYVRAVNGFLVSPGQGMNAPYRTLVAQLAITAALGKPFEWGMWHMAMHWAESTIAESSNPADKVWAQGCRAELWLLRLLHDEADEALNKVCHLNAMGALRDMMRMMDRSAAQPGAPQHISAENWIYDRLSLYTAWWSNEHFKRVIRHYAGAPASEGRLGQGVGAGMAALAGDMLGVLDHASGMDPTPIEAASDTAPPKAGKPRAKPPAPAATSSDAPEPVVAESDAAGLLGAAPPAARKVAAARLAPRGQAAAAGARFSIEMLAADQGDSLWIEWGLAGSPTRRMLVDCGNTRAYGAALKPRLLQLKDPAERRFELFILSHIDSDHIEGAIPLLKEARELGIVFGDIWFNGRKHLTNKLGARQAEVFSQLIAKNKLPWNRQFSGGAVVREDDRLPQPIELADGMRLTLLSPIHETLERLAPVWDAELTQADASEKLGRRQLDNTTDLAALAGRKFEPDPSKPNGSSIGVLAEFQGKRLLLGADVYAPVLQQALELLGARVDGPKLALDAFKLSHHGSRNNLTVELMQMLDCKRYLVSTNGDKHEHPDREAIARVVKYSPNRPELWFNYTPADEHHRFWFLPATQTQHGYTAHHPADGAAGIKLELI